MTTKVQAEPVSVVPPSKESFDGATRLTVGPEIDAIFERVLMFDEFKDLQPIPGDIYWFSKRRFVNEVPVFAVPQVVNETDVWIAERVLKVESFPRWYICLNWLNFEDLRDEGSFVTDTTVERHIYLAMLHLGVNEGGGITKRQSPIQTWIEAVKRYGAYDGELSRLQGALDLPEA